MNHYGARLWHSRKATGQGFMSSSSGETRDFQKKTEESFLENCRAVKKSAHRRRMTAAGLWAAWRRRRRLGPWVWELPEEPERRSGFRRCPAAPSRSWPGWSRTSDGLKQDWLFEMKEATQKNGANDLFKLYDVTMTGLDSDPMHRDSIRIVLEESSIALV